MQQNKFQSILQKEVYDAKENQETNGFLGKNVNKADQISKIKLSKKKNNVA